MTRRGFTIVEALALVVVAALMLGFTLPAIQTVSCDAGQAGSIANLRAIGTAHAAYAADWNDRQFTLVPDDLGEWDGNCANYIANVGCLPPAILGEDCHGETWGFYFGCDGDDGGCFNLSVVRPINWGGPFDYSGAFRLPNARGFHQYLNGRFYDPVMWAPKDTVVLNVVADLLDDECEYTVSGVVENFSSSYVLSPAAMYDPDVFAPLSEGGWRDPDTLATGYRSPTVSQALHPTQKSRMLEHHWLYRPVEPCNPGFDPGPYDGCQPHFFNHSKRSNPMTLFYDGHVRGLSVMEALISDSRVHAQTDGEEHLWSRDTAWGDGGYLNDYSYGVVGTSYHILTTGGIRGRDTVK